MPKVIAQLVGLLALLVLHPSSVGAQQPDRPPSLSVGDAVVTGFSGTLAPDPTKPRPANRSAIDLTFINPDGPSARVVGLGQPRFVWDGRLLAAPKTFDVFAKDVGQVFGIALDDQTPPNIYLAATSVFGLNIVVRGRDGLPERRKKGGPGAGWMKGQFGLELQGGPGSIYKVDGGTGVVSLLANVTLDGVPNPGPGLGNLAYDAAHKQLFVSDLYTGMIHRFALDGRDLGSYDHGMTGLGAAGLPPVPFNPRNRPNIASDRFDPENPGTWGFGPPGRQVWGLAVHESRLYYSARNGSPTDGPQIWSVGIEQDGDFAADARWELDVPSAPGPYPVSDIAFSQKGAMILAQRAPIAGSYDYSAFTKPGEPRVLRYWLEQPDNPSTPSRWIAVPEEYAVGFAGNYRNTNGGVALGYGYGQDGMLSTAVCEATLWTTGQNLRNNPALRSQLEPGGPLLVHGLQGSPADMVRNANEPPATSYFIDYDDQFDDPGATGHLGSVRVYATPCAPTAAVAGGPAPTTSPPYISGPPGPPLPPPLPPPPPPPPPPPADVGSLVVAKKVVNETPATLPSIPFPMTVTCGAPSNTTGSFSLTDGGSYTVNNIALGSTCTVAEVLPPPPPNVCPEGTVAVWSPPTYTPPSVSIVTGPPATITVVNTLQCKDIGGGSLIVKKVVKSGTPVAVPSIAFPMTVTCGAPSNTTVSFNLTDGVSYTVNNIALGSTCTVVEVLPPPPPNFCAQGTVAVWSPPPTYTPPSVNIIGGPPATITVVNTLQCEKQPVDLAITKTGPTTGQGGVHAFTLTVTNVGASFSIPSNGITVTDVASGLPGNITSVTASPSGPWACTLAGNTVNCLYTGSGLIAQNQVLGTITITYQLWSQGAYVDCATVGLTPVAGVQDTNPSNDNSCITVGNPQVGSLTVKKEVESKAAVAIPSIAFPMTLTCGAPSNTTVSFSLTDGGSYTENNIMLGSTCTVAEVLPPPPPNVCPQNTVAVWSPPPTYTPPSVNIGGGPPATITVVNMLDCRKIGEGGTHLECRAPMIPNPAGTACVCPQGTVLQGRECVRQIECRPPMIPGPVAGVCICPPRTVQKGRECVRRIDCRSPLIPNAAGTACVCPTGLVQRGRSCVQPTVCNPPAKLNRRGACECPTNMVARGNTCIEQQRKPRVIGPERIPGIGFPGPGPHGGQVEPGRR